jgi:hypothetical protein
MDQDKIDDESLIDRKEAVAGWLEIMEAWTDMHLNRTVEVMV